MFKFEKMVKPHLLNPPIVAPVGTLLYKQSVCWYHLHNLDFVKFPENEKKIENGSGKRMYFSKSGKKSTKIKNGGEKFPGRTKNVYNFLFFSSEPHDERPQIPNLSLL